MNKRERLTEVATKTRAGKKTKYAVIAGGAVLALFALGSFFRMGEGAIIPIGKCEKLSEDACIKRVSLDCQPVYGEDMRMKTCMTISENQLEERLLQRQSCEETAGEWHYTKYGPYCACGDTTKKFIPEFGCVE